jgi:hypothetical protein
LGTEHPSPVRAVIRPFCSSTIAERLDVKLGVVVEEPAATGAQRIGDAPLCVLVLTDLDPDDVPGRAQVPGVMLDMNRYTAGAASA